MEPLKDPLNDRVYKKLKAPPSKPLTSSFIWDNIDDPNKPNWKLLRNHLISEGKILKKDMIKIIKLSKEILSKIKRKRR